MFSEKNSVMVFWRCSKSVSEIIFRAISKDIRAIALCLKLKIKAIKWSSIQGFSFGVDWLIVDFGQSGKICMKSAKFLGSEIDLPRPSPLWETLSVSEWLFQYLHFRIFANASSPQINPFHATCFLLYPMKISEN